MPDMVRRLTPSAAPALRCLHFRVTGDRGDDDSGASVVGATGPGSARWFGRQWDAHPGCTRRVWHGADVAPAAFARSDWPNVGPVRGRRADCDDARAILQIAARRVAVC